MCAIYIKNLFASDHAIKLFPLKNYAFRTRGTSPQEQKFDVRLNIQNCIVSVLCFLRTCVNQIISIFPKIFIFLFKLEQFFFWRSTHKRCMSFFLGKLIHSFVLRICRIFIISRVYKRLKWLSTVLRHTPVARKHNWRASDQKITVYYNNIFLANT